MRSSTDSDKFLDANTIKSVMGRVRAPAKRCGAQHRVRRGTKLALKLTIDGSTGLVREVARIWPEALDAAADCVLPMLGQLQFPGFTAESMSFTYKVILRDG